MEQALELGASLILKGGGDCGDGGVTVAFSADPPGASLWMIVEFDFLLCELEGRSPWSTSECAWYEEPVFHDGSVWGLNSLVSGVYRYIARWPDGEVSCGKRRFLDEGLEAAVEDFSLPIVWIRKNGCDATEKVNSGRF